MHIYTKKVCTITLELWEFVRKLTMSKNERKGRKAAITQDRFAGIIKRLRRSYLLSVIMFLTNSECYSPFHVLLADAIECNGGSTELIKIFNRIGAVSTVETLKRVIQSVSQEIKSQGVLSLHPSDPLNRLQMLLSTNKPRKLDFIHTRITVQSYSGNYLYCDFMKVLLQSYRLIPESWELS